MSSLADLLLSYKQVKSYESPSVQLPLNKFNRMVEYSKAKANLSEPSLVSESSLEFPGWTYTHVTSYTLQPKNDWLREMIAAYKRLGLSDNAIKNLLAKNILESGNGKRVVGNFNYGNITAGSNYSRKTKQGSDKDQNGKSITQSFRSYDSIDDYVKDEIALLTRLYNFDPDDDILTFANKLVGKKRKYATDPEYSNKLIRTYNSL